MEEVRNSLEQSQKGKVYNTAANYKKVLQYDPLLKGAIRKNMLTERIDIVKPLGWQRDSTTLTDMDVKYLLLYFEENYGLTVEKKIVDAITVIANENRYREALGHDYDEPKQWELREINDIMNNAVTGWRAFANPRYFPEPYRRQRGWERIPTDNEPDNNTGDFHELTEAEMQQLELPEEWLR